MSLSKLAIRRITVLRDFMRRLPKSAEQHFAMHAWFRHTGDHDHGPRDKPISREILTGCGTTACAAGWAATIPAFRKAGFEFSPSDGFSIEPEKFFDLSTSDRGYDVNDELFYSYNIKTPKAWAAMATKVLKRERKIAASSRD